MKNRISIVIASLLCASLGGVAYAQTMPPSSAPPAAGTTSSMQSQSMANQNGETQSGQAGRIDRKVKQALRSHGVTPTDVNVSFSGGTATLTGTVYTQADIAKAKSAAMRVKGVKQVDTSGLHARAHKGAATGASTGQG